MIFRPKFEFTILRQSYSSVKPVLKIFDMNYKQNRSGFCSVKELLQLIEHPRKRTVRNCSEPSVDREQVRNHMRLKWKDPGFCNLEFAKAPNIKPKMLNQWEIQRINMATRSYVTPKQTKPYRFDRESRAFPNVAQKCYPVKFQRYLKQIQSQKQDFLFKAKRTITEGIAVSRTQSIGREVVKLAFKPVSTTTNLFGFTMEKGGSQGNSKMTKSRFKPRKY